MTKIKPLLVNHHEEITDQQLRKVATDNGARVCPKVGLKDVVSLNGLTHDLFSYGLKAHLDFVVVEESSNLPLFAVEADGGSHDDPRVQDRDKMKDAIVARAGLPLLRVDDTFMRSFRRYTLLTWLIDVWFLRRDWNEAQERGEIPWDEPFSHWGFLERDESGSVVDHPYDLAWDAKRALGQAFHEGLIPRWCPEIRMPSDGFFQRTPFAEAVALLEVGAGSYLATRSRCKGYEFPGVGPWYLVEDLAEIAIADKLAAYRRGEVVPASLEQVRSIVQETSTWFTVGQPFSESLLSDES